MGKNEKFTSEITVAMLDFSVGQISDKGEIQRLITAVCNLRAKNWDSLFNIALINDSFVISRKIISFESDMTTTSKKPVTHDTTLISSKF